MRRVRVVLIFPGAAAGCDLLILILLFCGSWHASDGGLTADQSLPDELNPCGSWLASDGGLIADQSLADDLNPCGSWLASDGGLKPTSLCQMNATPVGAGLPAMAA